MVAILGIGITISGVVWVLSNIFAEKNTSLSLSENSVTAISSLHCVASSPNNAFFGSRGAKDDRHEIKIAFRDNKPVDISYTLNAFFKNNDIARQMESTYIFNYNTYMSNKSTAAEALSPSFAVIDDKVKVNLYIEADKIDQSVAKMFFINSDQTNNFKNLPYREVSNMYNVQGFSCTYTE